MTKTAHPLLRKRGCLFWLASALALVAVVLAGLGAVQLAEGARAKTALRAQYPPPGQMVDVGGYKLHILCQGQGTPTVVMEAGLGDFSPVWTLVQPPVAEFARVCVYDRAGMGWSQRSPRPRTAAAVVEELHTLLGNARIAGPYILVGHSLGGMFVRLYAYTYPADVAGMVLVDSSHEDQSKLSPKEYTDAVAATYESAEGQILLVRFLTASGILAQATEYYPVSSKLPQSVADVYRALGSLDSSSLETMLAEHQRLDESSDQVRSARAKTIGSIPLIVLSRGQTDPLPSGVILSDAVLQQQERVWNELQGQLAALSPNGHRLIAGKSGHYVQLDQPDLVIDAIRQVLAALQK